MVRAGEGKEGGHAPLTVRSRPLFSALLWGGSLLLALLTGGLLLRALAWLPLVRQEPTLLFLFTLPLMMGGATLWLARWALFHSTVRVEVTTQGLAMRSAVAADEVAWEQVEAIHLQMTSGSEVRLSGGGHHVTVPSGSAPEPWLNQALQGWITARLNDRALDFGERHYWGP